MQKKILRFTPDLNFDLIAINSPLRDYRLCHILNTRLHYNFRKADDYQLALGVNEHSTYFSRYTDTRNSGDTELFLLSNRGGDGYLLPEMKSIDYLVLVRGYLDQDERQLFITGLNRLDEVHAVMPVDPHRLRSRENLIF